jgi:hypothetical protein
VDPTRPGDGHRRHRPKAAGLGPAAAGIEYGRGGLIREQPGQLLEPHEVVLMQRPKMPGGMTDPVCQRRAIQSDALAGVNLGLAIQQQMVGILGHQNLGGSGLGRQTALDRSAAQAPGLARHRPRKSGRHIWAEVRPHHIQPFTPVLADQLQLALAARTGLVVDVDDDLNPRQMRRQRSPVDPALVSPGPIDPRATNHQSAQHGWPRPARCLQGPAASSPRAPDPTLAFGEEELA